MYSSNVPEGYPLMFNVASTYKSSCIYVSICVSIWMLTTNVDIVILQAFKYVKTGPWNLDMDYKREKKKETYTIYKHSLLHILLLQLSLSTTTSLELLRIFLFSWVFRQFSLENCFQPNFYTPEPCYCHVE